MLHWSPAAPNMHKHRPMFMHIGVWLGTNTCMWDFAPREMMSVLRFPPRINLVVVVGIPRQGKCLVSGFIPRRKLVVGISPQGGSRHAAIK